MPTAHSSLEIPEHALHQSKRHYSAQAQALRKQRTGTAVQQWDSTTANITPQTGTAIAFHLQTCEAATAVQICQHKPRNVSACFPKKKTPDPKSQHPIPSWHSTIPVQSEACCKARGPNKCSCALLQECGDLEDQALYGYQPSAIHYNKQGFMALKLTWATSSQGAQQLLRPLSCGWHLHRCQRC